MLAAFQGLNKEEEMVTLEDMGYFFDCLESEHPPMVEDSATDESGEEAEKVVG